MRRGQLDPLYWFPLRLIIHAVNAALVVAVVWGAVVPALLVGGRGTRRGADATPDRDLAELVVGMSRLLGRTLGETNEIETRVADGVWSDRQHAGKGNGGAPVPAAR